MPPGYSAHYSTTRARRQAKFAGKTRKVLRAFLFCTILVRESWRCRPVLHARQGILLSDGFSAMKAELKADDACPCNQ